MIPIFDTLNRPLHEIRISVIDRCNFRCPYCMPEENARHYSFLQEKEWLTFAEIERLVKLFVKAGVKKVRLTGGEPLLRPNLAQLIQQLAQIKELEDLALTTNGTLLGQFADTLKKSGLERLTVSLDTLDSRVFKYMSGRKGDVQKTLEGIKQAEKAGFHSIKINVVVQKGVNDHTILDLVEYFRESSHILRFIEYMDVGNCNHWQNKYVVPSAEILKKINERYPLKSLEPTHFGEVAKRYEFVDGQGEIGFISSITQPFCSSCTRGRLSTDGKIFTCLFADHGTDLKRPLRQGASDEELLELIGGIWTQREDRYSERRSQIYSTHHIPHKVEMFQIGG